MEFNKKNIAALRALVKQYRKITVKDLITAEAKLSLTEPHPPEWKVLREITGFTSTTRCMVCRSVDYCCSDCFWTQSNFDNRCHYATTYNALDTIRTYRSWAEYIKKINERADYIEGQLLETGAIKRRI